MRASKKVEGIRPTDGIRSNSTYELFIFFLGIISLTMLLVILLPVDEAIKRLVIDLDFLFSLIFIGDLFRSVFLAPKKIQFMIRWGWIDALGSIPGFAILHLARLVRLMRAGSFLLSAEARGKGHLFLQRKADSTLLIISFLAVVVLGMSSLAIWELESQAPDSTIQSADDALWWAFVTMTTVGYGDEVPVTGTGRLVGAVLMLIGVGLFGALTSYLAAVFVKDSDTENVARLVEVREDVTSIKEEVTSLKSELADIKELLQQQPDETK